MAIDDYRHRLRLRVRWAEVDMQAVVFNGHYLTYADVCATEYWRAIGLPYPSAFAELGIDAFVRKATVEYHAPARYDDELLVCGRIARLGRSSAGFAVSMFRLNEPAVPLVDAELIYVCVDLVSGATTPWPPPARERMRDYETLSPVEASKSG
jgi:acyl-CoA thioester hydrolase